MNSKKIRLIDRKTLREISLHGTVARAVNAKDKHYRKTGERLAIVAVDGRDITDEIENAEMRAEHSVVMGW